MSLRGDCRCQERRVDVDEDGELRCALREEEGGDDGECIEEKAGNEEERWWL